MPFPTTHSQNTLHQPVVRQMPKLAEKAQPNNLLHRFLEQELKHWKADLEERRHEGKYYLDWFLWRESDSSESDLAKTFQRLVGHEIISLLQLIEDFSNGREESDLDQLLAVQRAYVQFCGRFDRIKLLILKKIDLKGNIRIY